MPQFDDAHVKAENCYVIYEAIRKPETVKVSGKTKWHVRVAIHPSNPDFQLLTQLQNRELQASFNGTVPSGGTIPLQQLGPNDAGGAFNGWYQFYAGTYARCPDLFVQREKNRSPERIDVMQIGDSLYAGQIVDVLVHAYSNREGRRGVAFGIDGLNIKLCENAQRLQLGGSGAPQVDTSSAFGATSAPQQQQAAPMQAAPMQAHNYLPGQQ